MRKGIAPINAELRRIEAVEQYWENYRDDDYTTEDFQVDQRLDRACRERPTESRCTCPPWAVNGWDGPDHDCPEHGCAHVHDGSWP